VTLDFLWRNHRDLRPAALHLNTGIGLQSTNAFVREFTAERGIPYHEAHSPISYEDMVRRGWRTNKSGKRQVGFPGRGAHRFSYVWLKERALDAFVSLQKDHRLDRIMLLTGVRAEESVRRMGNCVDVERDGAQVWVAPLIDWSDRDMQEHRTFYSVPMSPASSTIHMSGECYCGAFGDRREIGMVEAFFPDDPLPTRIKRLEQELEDKGVARCKWATSLPGDPEGDDIGGRLCPCGLKGARLPGFDEEAA
jgi:3'-phosphoadenosine 5'-phosphosulfate sulfotransferase (PAPS reductase)/FAD synthetase